MKLRGTIFSKLMIKTLEVRWYTLADAQALFLLKQAKKKASRKNAGFFSVFRCFFPLYKLGEKRASNRMPFSRQRDPHLSFSEVSLL